MNILRTDDYWRWQKSCNSRNSPLCWEERIKRPRPLAEWFFALYGRKLYALDCGYLLACGG